MFHLFYQNQHLHKIEQEVYQYRAVEILNYQLAILLDSKPYHEFDQFPIFQ